MGLLNNNANIKAVITAEDKASAVLGKFASNTEKSSQKAADGFHNSWLAVTAATTGIVAFGKKSLDAFNAQDVATARLEAGIKNVKSATDKNVSSLLKQAAALQKTTRFSDEAYISAQGILTTFQLNQDAIAKLTPRLADMSEGIARVSGGLPDLEGNAMLVAKALGGEDVIGLVGALRRVGVQMTEAQMGILTTGNMEQRLATITEVLDGNFKGLATSAGDTTAGKMAILKNQFGETQEKIGGFIATALTPLLNLLNNTPGAIEATTFAILGLATAFVAVKIAAGASAALGAVQAFVAWVSTVGVASLGLWSVAIAGIIADLYLVVRAAQAVKGAFADISSARASSQALQNSTATNRKVLEELVRAGTPAQKAQAQKVLNSDLFRASGGPVMGGQSYIVGEKGPEVFTPRTNGQIIPNGAAMGNIVVNIGMYAGTEMEKRKVAVSLMRAYQDALAGGRI